MRYQELIYIQNANEGVRNRDNLNVNMSSDISIFEAPSFIVSGASKINCSGFTSDYIITTGTTIPLSFIFTGNTDTFTANTTDFKFEIYKYKPNVNSFISPAIYKSEVFNYPSFSGTNIINQEIPINSLGLDGEFLIKGYYQFNISTDFLNKLGKNVDTLTYANGKQFGLYDNDLDFYFSAIKAAEKPLFLNNGSNTPTANQLHQEIILPDEGVITIVIRSAFSGYFILTLNGLVLAPGYDYTYSGNVVTLVSETSKGDLVTVIYTTSGGNNLVGDNIYITESIASGTTNNQGSNTSYYNTTTNKYEIYTSITPVNSGTIIVMINGVTLANGVDFYQSTSNSKRLILNGNIIIGDIITIVYFPTTNVVNGLFVSNPTISWQINNAPQLTNGFFSLEVSTDTSFSSLYSSGMTPYIIGKSTYYDTFTASGSVGSNLYYRVKNEKSYVTLCGNEIMSIVYSDIIPVTIQTNKINSY